MKVRMIRDSLGHVNGVSLRHYRANVVYDVIPNLANYLVAQGLALFEMRSSDRRSVGRDGPDRRSRR